MGEYLLTGRDAAGRSVTERIDADSSEEAVRIARDELGLDEVVLHTDDVGALYTHQSEVDDLISPRDFLRFRELPAPIAGFLVVSKIIYVQLRWLMLPVLAILLYRRWRGLPWGWLDWLEAIFLLWPAAFAAGAQVFRGQAGAYNKLSEAVAWGRWDEVLRLADELEGSKVPPEELAFRRGRALVGLGRVDEALEAVAPFGDGRIQEWLYHSRLPELYTPAGRYDDSHAALEHAAELDPENSTILLDLAQFEVRHARNPRRAREILDRARRQSLSDLVVPFARAIEAQIVREEGRPREAIPVLLDARKGIAMFRFASPLIGSALDELDAEIALAHAAAGDPDAALEHARRALPRLRALGNRKLIDRLRSAIGPGLDG